MTKILSPAGHNLAVFSPESTPKPRRNMITLAIDTSTPQGCVSVFGFGEILIEETFTADRSHSATLFETLEKARRLCPSIDQIVVGLGPGSYAGIRIGISAALGLQVALGAVLLGIPSVAALDIASDDYIVIGDARRDSYYFTHVCHGVCMKGPLLLSESQLREQLCDHAMQPVFATETLAAFPTVPVAMPSGSKLAQLAAEGRGIVQEGELEPIYLREPHITQPKVTAV